MLGAAGEAAYSVGMKSSPLQPQPQSGAGVRLGLAYTCDGTAVYEFKHTPAPVQAYQPPPASSAQVPAYQPPPASSSLVPAYQPPPASSAPRPRPRPRPVGGNGAPPALAISASADMSKRKRGRPRKYAPDGTMPLAVVPPSQPAGAAAASAAAPDPAPALPPGFSPGLGSGGVVSPSVLPTPPPPISEDATLLVKKRGRPPGSANKKPRQVAMAGSGATGLKSHVITVQTGEDIVLKVMSFSRNGWAVCILSANGAVSNVTLRQAASSGATVTYEGHFEILSLSGSYLVSESGGLSSRTGGLGVSLAGPDGCVLGGGVAGPLIAASPVQVVIGSFVADGNKESRQAVAIGIPGASSGSPGGPGSPPNQSAAGSFNTTSQPVLSNFSWK